MLAESIGCHVQISHQPRVFKTNFWGGYYPLHFLVLGVGDNLYLVKQTAIPSSMKKGPRKHTQYNLKRIKIVITIPHLE